MGNQQVYRRVFRWDDIPEEAVRHGVRRKAFASEQCMLVMNTLEPDMALNPHVHEEFDQLAYILEGRCHYFIDDEPHEMAAGSMLLVPAGSSHYIQPLGGRCLNLDIFTPPRADLAHLLSHQKG